MMLVAAGLMTGCGKDSEEPPTKPEDPDDPMACMHDCAKCSGCGPSELLKQIPVEEIK